MCNKWYVVYGTKKETKEKYVLACFKVRWKATKMCEQWGWEYDDGKSSYWLSVMTSDTYKEEEM